MRRLILIVISVGFTSLLPAQAQLDIKPDEATLVYLGKFRDDFVKSQRNGNAEAIQKYFGDNIRLMTETQLTMIGKVSAISYYREFAKRFTVLDYGRSETEILDLGSRVAEFGTFTEKLKIKNTGKEYVLRGKYLNIWEQSDDGKLSLVTEAWNYDHRVEIAQELVFHDVPTVNIALQSHVPIKDNISFELAALNHLQEVIISQHDAKIWSLFYADDYKLFRAGGPVRSGRKEIDAFLEEHVKELPIFEKLDIRNDHIDNLGEYVIEYASHTAIVRNGDWSGVGTGKDIRIWRREKDHSLKIIRGMGMYD